MTKLMEKAIEKLRSLPEEKQDAVAGFVLSEIQEDQMWEESSIKHSVNLRKVADEASDDFRAGGTSELDPDAL